MNTFKQKLKRNIIIVVIRRRCDDISVIWTLTYLLASANGGAIVAVLVNRQSQCA